MSRINAVPMHRVGIQTGENTANGGIITVRDLIAPPPDAISSDSVKDGGCLSLSRNAPMNSSSNGSQPDVYLIFCIWRGPRQVTWMTVGGSLRGPTDDCRGRRSLSSKFRSLFEDSSWSGADCQGQQTHLWFGRSKISKKFRTSNETLLPNTEGYYSQEEETRERNHRPLCCPSRPHASVGLMVTARQTGGPGVGATPR